MEQITEEQRLHDAWYEKAKEIKTTEELTAFIDFLLNNYNHDYGTICHAMAAAALATLWRMDKHPNGGITGLQAGAIMWEFIKHWQHIDSPMRLTNFGDMLYPQYASKFTLISKETWQYLQDQARKNLSGPDGSAEVRQHWQNIVNGHVPFGYDVEAKS